MRSKEVQRLIILSNTNTAEIHADELKAHIQKKQNAVRGGSSKCTRKCLSEFHKAIEIKGGVERNTFKKSSSGRTLENCHH